MKYTQIPSTAFQNIQLNAGILVDAFDPATGEIGNLLGATTGGISFADAPEFSDFGEDIDNCPKNMKELKKMTSHAVTMSGTFVTVTPATVAKLAGAADVDENDSSHIIPRNDLLDKDFKTIWWVGDYSDVNTGAEAGFIAIKIKNALNTGGFQIQSSDKGKGQFAFSYEGHYSMDAQDEVPYEIYIKGGSEPVPSIMLDKHTITIEAEDTATLTAVTVPEDATVTWASASSSVASVANGVITAGSSAGSTIITASITEDGVTYNDTCTVVVTE